MKQPSDPRTNETQQNTRPQFKKSRRNPFKIKHLQQCGEQTRQICFDNVQPTKATPPKKKKKKKSSSKRFCGIRTNHTPYGQQGQQTSSQTRQNHTSTCAGVEISFVSFVFPNRLYISPLWEAASSTLPPLISSTETPSSV